jgi:hypothetical protein
MTTRRAVYTRQSAASDDHTVRHGNKSITCAAPRLTAGNRLVARVRPVTLRMRAVGKFHLPNPFAGKYIERKAFPDFINTLRYNHQTETIMVSFTPLPIAAPDEPVTRA